MFLGAIILLLGLIYLRKSEQSTGDERKHYRMVAIVIVATPVIISLFMMAVLIAYQGAK